VPLAWLALGAAPALAQEAGEAKPAEAPDAATLEARRHFKSGTKLYRDGNYGGALAEFEEAYRLKPGPGSLQNVALSQKGLFRYSEAAATLEQLLARHGGELSDGERKAVDEALAELKSLIATIRLRVVPESARIVLDGRQLSPADLATPLVLNVGEHSLSVDAAGYGPEKRVLRLAGGQRDVVVDVELRCIAGFVEVSSNDPTAYIAIDGLPKARRAYRGPVEPDADHLLQVYREGVETFEQTFRVGACKTLKLHAELEGLDNAPPADPGDPQRPLPSAPPKRAQKGFFGMLTLDLLGLSRKPLDLNYGSSKGGGVGALGLRAGYRLSNPIALALRLDVGVLQVEGALDAQQQQRDFSLTSVHFGPDLKLMTAGERLRFIATIGAGVVHHRLALSKVVSDEVRGIDPYFALELGFGFNYRQFLGEIGLIAQIDGSTALQSGFSADANRELTENLGTTLPMIGIGLRAGFSQWRPGR
jgi:tetratricopeptide (TPR) repeat protein